MTSREFAKLLGISQATVSRALNDSDLVPEAKRKYIQQQAREHGFALNSHAKSLKTKHTGTIGVLFPKHFHGMNNNFMLAHWYDCIQRELKRYNYDIMVLQYSSEETGISNFERIVRTRKVDGFLIFRFEFSPSEVQLIEDYQIPCVFLLNDGRDNMPNISCFCSDSHYGGFLAGQFLGGFPEDEKFFLQLLEVQEEHGRLHGYRLGLQDKGCELPAENILTCPMGFDAARECILAAKDRLLGRKCSIFVFNDTLALGVIAACQELGVSIPDQIQILSIDDIPLARQLHPSLSTLHIAVEEIVPRGCQYLIDLINRKVNPVIHERVKPRLILRETTR